MEIQRTIHLERIKQGFAITAAVAIIGSRQVGKTTLAKQFIQSLGKENVHVFDLENPKDRAALLQPQTVLEPLRGYVIIDEVQRMPELFPLLRVFIDRKEDVKFLLLGSASRDVLARSSETLAGRISFVELPGYTHPTIDTEHWRQLWNRGGFPVSYMSGNNEESMRWRQQFITTFVEHDLPQLGIRIPSTTMRRFWTMLAHVHGQCFNASPLALSMGVSQHTIRHYLDTLQDGLVVRQIQPWFTNTKKRLVKSPKVYIRDSGILHSLLSIDSNASLQSHPILGTSFEGFVLENIIDALQLHSSEVFYWKVHSGAEIDLLWQAKGKLWGVEVKYSDAPTKTKSMQSVVETLDLEHLWVVYPGDKKYPLSDRITCLPLTMLQDVCSSKLFH